MNLNHPANSNGRSNVRINLLAEVLSCVTEKSAKTLLGELVASRQPGDLELVIELLEVGGDVGRAAIHLLVGYAKAGVDAVVPAMRACALSDDERRVRRARKVLALLGDRTSQLWLMSASELRDARLEGEEAWDEWRLAGIAPLPAANDTDSEEGVA